MESIPKIVPVTDLRQDASAILKRVNSSQEPVVITQRGRPAAILLSVKAYERSRSEHEILRQLARGEQEITGGEGYDLDDVLEEADRLLAGDGK